MSHCQATESLQLWCGEECVIGKREKRAHKEWVFVHHNSRVNMQVGKLIVLVEVLKWLTTVGNCMCTRQLSMLYHTTKSLVFWRGHNDSHSRQGYTPVMLVIRLKSLQTKRIALFCTNSSKRFLSSVCGLHAVLAYSSVGLTRVWYAVAHHDLGVACRVC